MTRAGFFLALVLMIPMEPDWACAGKTYRVDVAIANDQSINVVRVKEGALAACGADFATLRQPGAILVDKILKGSRPENLPIEQPVKLKLVLNMKTAKAIGLNISREILLRADEVIE